MRKSTFFALLALTAMLIAAAVLLRQGRTPNAAPERERLIPELHDRINDVARIEIKTKDKQVTLVKTEDRWVVDSRGGYPADFEKIKGAVVALAETRILETKTSNRELYPRLGVEALDVEGSSSKLVTLDDAKGETIASVIAGKMSTGRLSGTYVRPPNTAQALLVSGQLDVEADPISWMDRELVNIAPERVSEVVIEAPGKPRVRIYKQDAKAPDYTLEALPAGKKVKSQVTVNSLATILEHLSFDDVVAVADFTLPKAPTITTVRTFDGLEAIIKSAVVKERTHAVLVTTYDAAAAAKAQSEASKSGDETPATEKAAAPKEDTGDEAADRSKSSVADEVATLNAKLSGWVYVLPSYKGEMLAKSMADLLEEPEAGNKPSAGTP